MNRGPFVKELVLLGGGHSHVEVLRSFGMRPVPGVRLTLITRDMMTPYSGMLPGYISGFYSYEDCHIDLARLASFAQARLIHAEACRVDVKTRRIYFKNETPGGTAPTTEPGPEPGAGAQDRPPVSYDVLSVGIGITPGKAEVVGASEHTTGVKPIDQFVQKLEALLERYRGLVASCQAGRQSGPSATESPQLRVVVVGGGPGGVEVALSLQHRLEVERVKMNGPDSCRAQVTLVCRGPLLGRNVSYVQQAFKRLLKEKGVSLLEGGGGVAEVQAGRLRVELAGAGQSSSTVQAADDSSAWIPFDECLWCTQAAAASWLKETGLPVDASGFLRVNDRLQSDGGPPEVFAAGDVASCTPYPRPKAGVFAVRQGAPLAANLRRYLSAEPLVPFVPQSTFLSLITAGDQYCVGTKGWVSLEGRWLWNWKDSIDRSFMLKYGAELPDQSKMMAAAGNVGPGTATSSSSWLAGLLPSSYSTTASTQAASTAPPDRLAGEVAVLQGGLDVEAAALFAESRMRCGGCGSKVGASVLSRVLSRLPAQSSEAAAAAGVLVGLGSPDDAAVIRPPPPGHVLIQTVDYFKALMGACQDPYVLGQVAAHHALSDCFAMGGQPATAMAIATVPLASEKLMEEDLTQMMSGAIQALNMSGCVLVGGHTSEGDTLGLGFSITGTVEETKIMAKGGLRPGQALILTKPIGTGIILKAFMKGQAVGNCLPAALRHCASSNATAAKVLAAHGSTGCTDVTGFGLIGHMVEMARASETLLELDLDAIPLLDGASHLTQAGSYLSSIHTQNARAAAAISNFELLKGDVRWPLLVDPQTGGGLLAGVPASEAEVCIKALQAQGCTSAAVIGWVKDPGADASRPIKVKGWNLGVQ